MLRHNSLYTPETHPVVAIDLDSTIWTEDYPYFGEPFSGAISTINEMFKMGYDVIIWTSRGGGNLDTCIDHLREVHDLNSEIKFNAHSKIFTDKYPSSSPKIGASIYIDDKAYGAPESFENEWSTLAKKFLGRVIYER